MDEFYISYKKLKYAIFHLIDAENHINAAFRLKNMETTNVWNVLIKCCTSIYTELPNRIIVDKGSHFGDSFIIIAALLEENPLKC